MAISSIRCESETTTGAIGSGSGSGSGSGDIDGGLPRGPVFTALSGPRPRPRPGPQISIHPWAARPTNHVHPLLQARPVMVPDMDPVAALSSMQVHAESVQISAQEPVGPSVASNGMQPTDPRLPVPVPSTAAAATAATTVAAAATTAAADAETDPGDGLSAPLGTSMAATHSLSELGPSAKNPESGSDSAPLPSPSNPFSMAAGEFERIYDHPNHEGKWSAIACCFFLDTAPNIMRYLEVIWRCLEPGGVLVSLGPLLYHWADRPAESLFNLNSMY